MSTRTIMAVVSPADAHDAEVNVQLFSEDNRVYQPVFRLGAPVDHGPASVTESAFKRAQMETLIVAAASESYHVGGCHGIREVYHSPQQTIHIYELDFDRIELEDNHALKYNRI